MLTSCRVSLAQSTHTTPTPRNNKAQQPACCHELRIEQLDQPSARVVIIPKHPFKSRYLFQPICAITAQHPAAFVASLHFDLMFLAGGILSQRHSDFQLTVDHLCTNVIEAEPTTKT